MEVTLPIQERYSVRSEYGLGDNDLVLDLGNAEAIPALSILDPQRIRTIGIRFEPGARQELTIAVKAVPSAPVRTTDEAFELATVVIRPATTAVLELEFTLAIADDILFAHVASDAEFAAELSRPSVRALDALEAMVGLGEAKRQVRAHLSFLEIQAQRKRMNMPSVDMSRHLVFVGGPGTGKTTVARLIGRIYRGYGICKTDAFVEVDRAGLVAGYVGQTAERTTAKLNEARGGILFIDEAYTLAPANNAHDFGKEAIDTIVKFMEDHRDEIIVIAAGYQEEMERLIASNPGLASRFKTTINFLGYSPSEMLEIFDKLCEQNAYRLAEEGEVRALVQSHFASMTTRAEKGFAHAREVRNFFENCIQAQAERVTALLTQPTSKQVAEIEYADVVKVAFRRGGAHGR